MIIQYLSFRHIRAISYGEEFCHLHSPKLFCNIDTTFFNLNLKKVAKRKEHSLRNLEITTYTSCNGPQICLLQMHPLTEKFLFKETQTKKENTLYLVLYSYSPFQMNCKTERQGTLFYVFVQSTKQKPFNFLFCILKNSNDSRRMKTINKIIFIIPSLYFKHTINLEYNVRQYFYIQKYANYMDYETYK